MPGPLRETGARSSAEAFVGTCHFSAEVPGLAGTANATAATMSDLQFGFEVVSATAKTLLAA